MKFGIQMFGAYQIFKQNPEKFFSEAARAGFSLIEPRLASQSGGVAWNLEQLEKYLKLMGNYGLSVYSCQILPSDFEALLPKLKNVTEKYGIRQYVLPCPSPVTEEHYQKEIQHLKELAIQTHSFGAELLLHNSAEESAQRFGKMTAYEWLLEKGEGKLGAQVDVGWLLYGGEDPEAFLWRNRDRVRSLHYKDMKWSQGKMTETSIGKGLVDMIACFQFARAQEIPQIMDQDSSNDMAGDIRETGALLKKLTGCRERTKSTLCIFDTETGKLKKLHTYNKIVEAPNWSKDGKSLFFNSEGHIYKYSIETDEEELIESGICNDCNNDHVLSPDGTQIAVSHCTSCWQSQIFILPIEGGKEEIVVSESPSFLHGWSPDGKELSYCGMRDYGNGMEVDIYTISVNDRKEKRLTRDCGFNDGPEYSPDGKSIWFHSTRNGLTQIFRMNAEDGSNQIQMTDNERNNWFPHISPDGNKVVYLSYSKNGLEPEEHLPNMNVELWMMDSNGENHSKILGFFGGQGSINVNSWSQDSRNLAMVIYELEHK